ncbi:MAG: efflux RND transporter periplasmic adaptor subunit [Cytophagaceae bacterium]
MKKSLRSIVYIALAAVVIFLIALPKIRSSEDASAQKFKASAPQAVPVKVVITQGVVLDNTIKATGSVMANEEVILQPEAAGRVTKIYFNEGEYVKQGTLLLKIEDSELQAELSKVIHQKKLAEEQEKRQKTLLSKGGVSQSEYDVAQNELNILKSEEVLLRARIAKTELRAPFSGMIGLRNISLGSNVTTSTTIASIQDINKLKIEFSVPQKYAAQVRKGQQVSYTINGLEQGFNASIYAIDPKIDPNSRTIMVRALSTSHSKTVYPGAFANVEIILDKIEDGIVVPAEAIVPDIRGHKVYLYKNGQVEIRPVEIGTRKENSVYLSKGLASGDTVITSGMLQLRPGSQVKIQEVEN